ncbi:MAG: hypothetical protein ABSE87_15780 [Terracidiphilus sp.]
MQRPDPELIDDENPEWTDEDFAKAVHFSALPAELQALLSSPKKLSPDADASTTEQPAA